MSIRGQKNKAGMVKAHRPFLLITVFYSAGIITDLLWRIPFRYGCLMGGVFLIAGKICSKRALLSTVFLLLALGGLGSSMSQCRLIMGKDHIYYSARYFYKKPVFIKGVINSSVENRRAVNGRKTTFNLGALEIQTKRGWRECSGSILVNVFRELDVAYGDRILLEGKLHKPYNFSSKANFSYRDYLSRRGIYYILSVKKNADIRILGHGQGNYFKAKSLRLRDYLKNILSENLTDNEAGIMQAILLGDRTWIPKPVRTLFVQTGTAHILAISGLHIGIVAGLFMLWMKIMPISRQGQLGCMIVLLIGYAFLTGGRPSVVRATIMMIVLLISYMIEKEPDSINTLSFAAFIILTANPLNIFDIGFQLSFVCVFSIIYLNSQLKRRRSAGSSHKRIWIEGASFERYGSYIVQSLYISLAIWIGVAGFIAYYFGIITPITILANLLIIPLISIIVPLGFCLLGIGLIIPAGTFIAGACLKLVLNIMVGLIYLCAKIPFAYFYIDGFGLKHITAYYAVLILLILCPWVQLRQGFKLLAAKFLAFGRMVRHAHHR